MSSSSRKLDAVETEKRGVKSNTTEDPGCSGFRKLERNSVSPGDKKPKFEVDLGVEGVPEDTILKDGRTNERNQQKVGEVANTKTVSTPREKLQDQLVSDGRKSPTLKREKMQHDTDLRA